MIQFNSVCKVCKKVKREQQGGGVSKLAQRIYGCSVLIKGGEALTNIQRDYVGDFEYSSLRNHALKHQNLTEDLLVDKRLREMGREINDKRVKNLIGHVDLRQAIMDTAAEMLAKGELKGISASTALRAAKDASDIEEKNKDRGVEVLKMYNFFASGSNKPELVNETRKSLAQNIIDQAITPIEPDLGPDGE